MLLYLPFPELFFSSSWSFMSYPNPVEAITFKLSWTVWGFPLITVSLAEQELLTLPQHLNSPLFPSDPTSLNATGGILSLACMSIILCFYFILTQKHIFIHLQWIFMSWNGTRNIKRILKGIILRPTCHLVIKHRNYNYAFVSY